MMSYVTAPRLVVVPATELADLLELARLAVDRLPAYDPLCVALLGAWGAVRHALVVEP